MTNDLTQRERPAVVSMVAIVVFISATITAARALNLFLNRDEPVYRLIFGPEQSDVVWTAIIEGLFALALYALGIGILRGIRGARAVLAFLLGLQLVFLTWQVLDSLGDQTLSISLVVHLAIALFVLWALYGNPAAERFFLDDLYGTT